MGPIKRQVLRVLHVAHTHGVDHLSFGQIARVLTNTGIPVRAASVSGAVSGMTLASRACPAVSIYFDLAGGKKICRLTPWGFYKAAELMS